MWEALLPLAAECCGQAHSNAELYTYIPILGATVYFKWGFNLFEMNATTLKSYTSDSKESDGIGSLQFMAEQLSLPPAKDFSIL